LAIVQVCGFHALLRELDAVDDDVTKSEFAD